MCKDEDFHGYAHTQSSFLTLSCTQTKLLHIDKYMRVCVWNRLLPKDFGGWKQKTTFMVNQIFPIGALNCFEEVNWYLNVV